MVLFVGLHQVSTRMKSVHISTTACVRYPFFYHDMYAISLLQVLYQVILYGFYTDTRLS